MQTNQFSQKLLLFQFCVRNLLLSCLFIKSGHLPFSSQQDQTTLEKILELQSYINILKVSSRGAQYVSMKSDWYVTHLTESHRSHQMDFRRFSRINISPSSQNKVHQNAKK